MDSYAWIDNILVIVLTLVPFFLSWATALLWRQSDSGWALAALIGSLLAAAGMAGMWIGFFIHYSSGATMHAENVNPRFLRQAINESFLIVGCLVSSLSLVGYARTRGKE